MDLVVTSDTGPVGATCTGWQSECRTPESTSPLPRSRSPAPSSCLSALPTRELRPRVVHTLRDDRGPRCSSTSVCPRKRWADAPTAQQRETLGELLRHWIGRASRSRTAPWSPSQRAELRHAAEQSPGVPRMARRSPHPRRRTVPGGLALDDIAEATGTAAERGRRPVHRHALTTGSHTPQPGTRSCLSTSSFASSNPSPGYICRSRLIASIRPTRTRSRRRHVR